MMGTLVHAFWLGLVNGANVRERSQAQKPEAQGLSGTIAQAVYWAGFQISNVVVYGAGS